MKKITALKVRQWLNQWDNILFDSNGESNNRKKPKPYFYLFKMNAKLLKRLSKVYPRRADELRDIEIGIQRKHDKERSVEINNYIKVGYPLSTMKKKDNLLSNFNDLMMPGWLPTAIIANILSPGSTRGSHTINDSDLISLTEVTDEISTLTLPTNCLNPEWNPTVPPIEIIDGQHRLWAFSNDDNISDEYELPVVAFHGLDITWQAYLFYTINVKPKKINQSLAYDLYPLLRVQDWLEKSPDTANIYRETRAQEIVETLWAHELSPWYNKINMIGDKGTQVNITQAAFIRNLNATFIKSKTSKALGGLYGAKLLDIQNIPLGWNRTQQSAFMIFIWKKMYESVENCTEEWANSLRNAETQLIENNNDQVFFGKFSLISTDQGVRGYLNIINDFCYLNSNDLSIRKINWSIDEELKEDYIDPKDVTQCLLDLEQMPIASFIEQICKELVKFDWRTSSAPGLSDERRRNQMLFKGSSGYKEIREQLLILLSKSDNQLVSSLANQILIEIGYERN